MTSDSATPPSAGADASAASDGLSGRCMCGQVTYTIAAAPVAPVVVCRCVDRRRQTGSAYTIVATGL